VGEGVIYDLRSTLFARLQHMSLHFFTNTKTGELMSRLNNDVVGAQNAISNTIVSIVTSIVEAIASRFPPVNVTSFIGTPSASRR
jgi:ATP-binding cassette subfamily B protein